MIYIDIVFEYVYTYPHLQRGHFRAVGASNEDSKGTDETAGPRSV